MKAWLAVALLLVAGPAAADCHQTAGIPGTAAPAEDVLFVLVDRTTVLDGGLREDVQKLAAGFAAPRRRVVVVSFSAHEGGEYVRKQLDVAFEGELSAKERDETGKRALQAFDACVAKQRHKNRAELKKVLAAAMPETADVATHSELIGSMANISRSLIAPGPGHKRVLLVSDMLEHSSTTTFYKNKALRKIEAPAELQKAKAAGLLGDFGGAEVYVLGAGMVANDGGAASRQQEEMSRVHAFWESYFAASRGKLAEWGQPALLGELH